MIAKKFALLLLAAPLFSPVRGAEKSPAAVNELNDIVLVPVTVSSARAESLIGSTSTVSVLHSSVFDRYGISDVRTALDLLAGVFIDRSMNKQGVFTTRGILQDFWANKNLVLIDGIPTWHALSGEHNVDRVGLGALTRIEVLKGPASVLYGSQAYTGAANLVLRQPVPGETSGRLHTGFGTRGAYETGAHVSSATADGFGASVSYNLTRGARERYAFTDEVGVTADVTEFFDGENVTLRLSQGGHSLVANGYRNREMTLSSFGQHSLGAGGPHHVEGALVGYKLKHTLRPNWRVQGMAFYDYSHRRFPRSFITREWIYTTGYRAGGNARSLHQLGERLSLDLGVDYEQRVAREQSTRSPTNIVYAIRDTALWERSAFSQLEWTPAPWKFVAGARLSQNELSGSHLSSRLTAVRMLGDQRSVKLVAAQSYRSPSLFELFNNTTANVGNARLQPETADSVEAVYQAKQGNLLLQAVGYYARYSDKIFRVPDPARPSRTTYANGDVFSAIGLECEASYHDPMIGSFFANLDWQNGTDGDRVRDTMNPGRFAYNFRYLPTWRAAVGAAKSWRSFSASVVGRYTPDTDGPRATVDAFLLVDVSLNYTHTVRGWRLRHTLSGENILGEKAAYPEFSRRRLNEIVDDLRPKAFYRVGLTF